MAKFESDDADEAPLVGIFTEPPPEAERGPRAWMAVDWSKCVYLALILFAFELLLLGAHNANGDHRAFRAIVYWLNDHIWGWR